MVWGAAAAFGVVPSIPSAIMTAAAAAVNRAKWKWYSSLRGGQKRPDLRRVSIREQIVGANLFVSVVFSNDLFKRGQNGRSIFIQGLFAQQCFKMGVKITKELVVSNTSAQNIIHQSEKKPEIVVAETNYQPISHIYNVQTAKQR